MPLGKAQTMNVRNIIAEYLKNNGYNGLYNDDDCYCKLYGVMPCGLETPCEAVSGGNGIKTCRLPQNCGGNAIGFIPCEGDEAPLTLCRPAPKRQDGEPEADVRNIVTEYLKNNGYSGLHLDDKCECRMDNLIPCDNELTWVKCKPGIRKEASSYQLNARRS